MARCSPSFWRRLQPKNSCCSSNSVIWKEYPSAKRLLAHLLSTDQNQKARLRSATKSWIWQHFPNTRSIDRMAYLTGEARAQLDAFKAVMVKHARLQEIDQALSLVIEEHADSTHVLLCGPGGVGKSTVLKGVTERFTREEVNRAIVP